LHRNRAVAITGCGKTRVRAFFEGTKGKKEVRKKIERKKGLD